MDRAHRRRAHHPRVRDAGPAAAARRARHPGRPVGDGPARAFGTPRHHRTGAPCAPGLVAGPDAQEAAEDLLTPVLRNHAHRAYAWAAAIAARRGITFDRELLYLAAMFHDTGLPSPVPHVDFTVRSAALAREFADRHGVPADSREVVTNAIAMHHTPGVGLESGPEAYLMSAGAAVDVFGSAATRSPTRSAGAWSSSSRGLASSANSPRCGARRPSRSLAAERGTCTASPSPT